VRSMPPPGGSAGSALVTLAEQQAWIARAYECLSRGDTKGALAAIFTMMHSTLPEEEAGRQIDAIRQQLLDAGRPGLGGETDEMPALLAAVAAMSLGASGHPAVPAPTGAPIDEGSDARMEDAATLPGASTSGRDTVGGPILGETGMAGIVDAALADGSSFRCRRCQGVFAAARRDAHELWCDTG